MIKPIAATYSSKLAVDYGVQFTNKSLQKLWAKVAPPKPLEMINIKTYSIS